MASAAYRLYAYVLLDQGGQLDRQLIQIGDVQEGIAVDAFDARLVVADGCGNEENALAGVFLLDPAKILLGCRAVVTVVSRLTVGYQDQELHGFRSPGELLGDKAQGGAVAVAAAGGNVHETVLVIVVDTVKLRIRVELDSAAPIAIAG